MASPSGSAPRSKTICNPSRTDFRSARAPATAREPFAVKSSIRLRGKPSSLAKRRSVRRLVGTETASRISSFENGFGPADSRRLRTSKSIELLDPLGPAPQTCDVERVAAYPLRVVCLQRVQEGRIDVAAVAPLQHRSVPGVVARPASVDQPGVETLAIGVQPELLAAAKRSDVAASAACEPWLRGSAGYDGPLDAQNTGHAGLPFPSGSSSERQCRGASAWRRGVAGSLRRLEIRRADSVRQRLSHAKPVSNRHPMNAIDLGNANALPRGNWWS